MKYKHCEIGLVFVGPYDPTPQVIESKNSMKMKCMLEYVSNICILNSF